ncbi:MAG: protein kinase [Chloroflexota bacterium]|nr:protein kinase [Chloroflexota bacterium]
MLCPSCGHENRPSRLYCAECGSSLRLACGACGTQNEPGEKFCGRCGASLTEVARPPPTPTATTTPAPATPASFAAGRYQVQRFLGEGGKKRVYLAHDTRLDRDVAISLIKTEGLDAAGRARVRREAQAMGRLGDHPHIVTVFDVGEEAGQPYIVSQFMEGGSVQDLVEQAPEHRLPTDQSLQIASEVCQALRHAHDRGIIHRDVKPGNIWLTADGHARLGDFGLAVALNMSRLTQAGAMVGTVAYMPPEQALGGDVDARSDLYGLGGTLYEMLTGRPPFLGDDALSIISQHVNTPPVAPTWHNPQVPKGVEDLVMGLLAKDPQDRPASAQEVGRLLAELATVPVETVPAAPPGVGRLAWGRFVGREKELGELKARLEEALSGKGSLVMVVGEPGIGKTRLAQEVGVYARLRGCQVLLGTCYETEGALPYIPFVEALRQYVMSRPAEALQSELGEAASDVAKLVSEIRTRVPNIPPSPPQDPEAERYRLFESVAFFLVSASRSNPLLLLLDDIHWADKPSLLMLQHLARRLRGSRLLVIGTYRDVELDRRHPLSQVLAELRRERLYERILLRGLSEGEVDAFIAAIAGHQVPRQFALAIHRETEGNPFFVEETLRHLVETGVIYRRNGQWVSDAASISEMGIPEGVREVIGRRLSRLSDPCNQALSLASILGREFDFDVLSAFAEMEGDALLTALEEALEAQLITEQKGRGGPSYRFTHALVQETLYGELSIARKQRLHLRAGQAIEKARAGRLEAHVPQLAHHFREGNDPPKAIQYSLQAAEAAGRVYAWEAAISHGEAALELMDEQGGDLELRAQLLERLGDLIFVSGIDYERGIAHLERALALYEQLGQQRRVALVHSRLGRNLVSFIELFMDQERGVAHLRAAQAILEQEEPEGAALAYVYCGLATAAVCAVDVPDSITYGRKALAIGEKLQSEPVVALANSFLGHHLVVAGRLAEGLALLEKAWEMADRANLTFVAFLSAFWVGVWWGFLRGPEEGMRWLRQELAKPRIASAPNLRRSLLAWLGASLVRGGEAEEAQRILAEEPGELPTLSRLLHVAKGEWEAAEREFVREIERSRGAGDRLNSAIRSAELAEFVLLKTGDYSRAEELLLEARRIFVEGGAVWLELWFTPPLCELYAKTGRLDEAQELMDRCQAILGEGEDYGAAVGRVSMAQAILARAREQWTEAQQAFDRALAVARRYGLPWEEARALHEQGIMHLARAQKEDREKAVELLDQAIAIYQRMGAKKDVELVLADKMRAQGIDLTAVQSSIDAVASAVYAERPDLRPHAAPDGTVTIMFSDIEGSTEMNERLGDEKWLAVLREHNTIVRRQVKAHDGFEVKSQGDGFMVAFQSARRALQCAVGIQRAIGERNRAVGAGLAPPEGAARSAPTEGAASSAPTIRVRMGLHTGEAIKEGEDFFGKNVILAARIASQAKGGEILASGLLKELTESAGEFAFGEGRAVSLKGISGKHRVFQVEWE